MANQIAACALFGVVLSSPVDDRSKDSPKLVAFIEER
jgi:hypothetical protein